jgi:hypothetical protein
MAVVIGFNLSRPYGAVLNWSSRKLSRRLNGDGD